MSTVNYIPLRAHSDFSITDGIIRVQDLVKTAAQYGCPALGLGDLMNTFGLIKFYKACRKMGVKPIMGADIRIAQTDQSEHIHRALLLIRNAQGYKRLSELLTRAHTEQRHPLSPHILPAWLSDGDNSGLLCLSGAHMGEVGSLLMLGHQAAAEIAAQKYAQWFPNAFYLELQRLPEKPEWERCVSGSLKVAMALDLPVVATHPTQFLTADDFLAHDTRVCIAGGWTLSDPKRPRDFVRSQYFASPDEVAARFADIPEALQNTLEIAKRCNQTLTLGQNFLPDFPTPNGMDLSDYMRLIANQGLQERLMALYPDESERISRQPEYQQRLDFELDTIIQMGFSGYFLIVQDFINWAKNNGCPVGPGRGSGAGSLVAYSLKITDLDPLKYTLLFERFLNPERVSMPDFDIDFCQENRGRVIEYVREKYGKDAVSQIITFGTLSSKAVIRDVGRVLQLPFSLCDKLSKLVPIEKNKPLPLQAALNVEPEISQILDSEEAWDLMNLAMKLEDLTRNLGMHAGGVLIAPNKISDFCGVYQADESAAPVSMYDKGDVEDVGLVKFDFLGLRNLTIIEMAQQFIKQTTGKDIDVNDVNVAKIDDQAAYQIFRDANTTAVFQFESSGMKKMLSQTKTTNLEEIIAFVSLYRPGPMDLIPDFIARMKGAQFEYMHPLLKPVLEPTYGIMVYQEQVMQAAQLIGGYSLGGADVLRRAMGKKQAGEMAQHREIFAQGAAQQGINQEKANEIFDYMEKFAGYGFNKSHAAAYAYISFQTAWLKAHYPAEFMAATMSSELDNTDQLKIFYDDARSKLNGIEFLPPDINESFYRFIPNHQKQIRYALGAIKGTGEAAVNSIVHARETGGRFKNLFDFCERVGKHVNRRTIEALIRAGAFDAIESNRAMLLANVELAIQNAEQKASHVNQSSLFDMLDNAIDEVQMQPETAWSDQQKLAEEKTAIGFYLSGHPFAPYRAEICKVVRTSLAKLCPSQDTVRVAGFVTSVRAITGKHGKFWAITLEDGTAVRELILRGEVLEQATKEVYQPDQVLIAQCRIFEDHFSSEMGALRLNAVEVYTLPQARAAFARGITLRLNPDVDIDRLAEMLHANINQSFDRRISIKMEYENAQACGVLLPSMNWRVGLSVTFLADLHELLGENRVLVEW